MNVFTTVKTSINLGEAAEHYGIKVNRYGKALCPFHNDRHPSMVVYDDHYHCFACGEHGDVIDLVANLYGMPVLDAVNKLAYDFGISQDKPPTKEMQVHRGLYQLEHELPGLHRRLLGAADRILRLYRRDQDPLHDLRPEGALHSCIPRKG